jgi:hypothetical protein
MSLGAKLTFVFIAFIAFIIVASVIWFETHLPIGYQ